MNIIDTGGYELVDRHMKLGQYVAEICAVEMAGSGDSFPKELSKTGDVFQGVVKEKNLRIWLPELRHRRGCDEQVRSCAGVASKGRETGSMERLIKKGEGQVSELRELPAFDRVRAQINSGAHRRCRPEGHRKGIRGEGDGDVKEGRRIFCGKAEQC